MASLRRERDDAQAASAAQDAQRLSHRHSAHHSGISDAMHSLRALQDHAEKLQAQLHALQLSASESAAQGADSFGDVASALTTAPLQRHNVLEPLASSLTGAGAANGSDEKKPPTLGRSATQAELDKDDDGESPLKHLFRARCRDLYKQVDSDMSNTLEADELEPVVHAWLPDIDVKKMIADADTDGSGFVGEDEFVEMMMSHEALDQLAEINKLHTGVEAPEAVAETLEFAGNDFIIIGEADGLLWSPFTPVLQYFEMVVTLVLIVTILTTPLSLAFKQIEDRLMIFDLVVDCIFLTDVVRNLNTGVVTDADQIIFDRKTITKRYLRSWFFPDLLSSLPYNYMTDASRYIQQSKKGLKMLRLLRLGKIARLMRMSQVVRTLREPVLAVFDKLHITIDAGVAEVGKLLLFFFVCVHWIACVNFMISREYGFPEYSWTVSSGLVTLGEPDYDAEAPTPSPTGDADADEGEEPALVVIAQAPISHQYKWCLHKALLQMIMVGHGENGEAAPTMATSCHDITLDYCATEYWFTLVCLYIGFGFQTYLTSQFLTILVEMSISGQRFREEVRTAGEYMRHKGLPADLRDRVREFYAVKYRSKKVFDERSILARFSMPLRQEILNYNSRELLVFVPLLKNCPNAIFQGFARAFENSVHSEGDNIFQENDDAANEGLLYFMRSGMADVLSQSRGLPGKYTPRPIASLGEGCYFGDVALMLDMSRRTATVRCTTTCICYTIERDALDAALRDFPYVIKYMATIARRRFKRTEDLSTAAEKAWRDDETDLHHYLPTDWAERNVDEEDEQTAFYQERQREREKRAGLRKRLIGAGLAGASGLHLQHKAQSTLRAGKTKIPTLRAGKPKVHAVPDSGHTPSALPGSE